MTDFVDKQIRAMSTEELKAELNDNLDKIVAMENIVDLINAELLRRGKDGS